MKKKLLSLLMICIFVGSTTIYAEEDKTPVDPNIYEKKEININSNFRDNLKQKEQLPEEQKGLTFEKPEKTDSNLIKDRLFQSFVIETNTITSKSDQLGLFSQAEGQVKRDKEEEQTSSRSNVFLILMVFAAIVIVAMFFLIIPRLKHTHN